MVSSSRLSRIVVNSVKAILGEDYIIQKAEKLPSRRNDVYFILGSSPTQNMPNRIVVKYYNHPGIALETSMLNEAKKHKVPVPTIIGSTAEVLLLEYINAPNLCDLIALYPDPIYGHLLGSWLAHYHVAFAREADQVVGKGDARIRNFLVAPQSLIGVDFEESHVSSYIEDLATACASVLDTTPLFTKEKLHLCAVTINHYAEKRRIQKVKALKSALKTQMVLVLKETAARRRNPAKLEAYIHRFQEGSLSF
jgi:tRNA A-37 threonylcarbamoyl transferase component Bud32